MVTIIRQGNCVSGIFLDETKALQYLDSNKNNKEPNASNYNVEVTSIENYPFYIMENVKTKEFIFENCKDKVYQMILGFEGQKKEYVEGHYLNIYIIRKDYYPKTFLGDYMGGLEHIHFSDSDLEVAKKFGDSYLVAVFGDN
jgi:hypothetical protein